MSDMYIIVSDTYYASVLDGYTLTLFSLRSENLSNKVAVTIFRASVAITMKNMMSNIVRSR